MWAPILVHNYEITKLRNYEISLMRPQTAALLLFATALALFLFSMALLPPVELYCRLRIPAIALFFAQILLLTFIVRRKRPPEQRPLAIANVVFVVLGLAFNIVLLVSARGRC
jgi:FtsH-binding integral membrane protein